MGEDEESWRLEAQLWQGVTAKRIWGMNGKNEDGG